MLTYRNSIFQSLHALSPFVVRSSYIVDKDYLLFGPNTLKES